MKPNQDWISFETPLNKNFMANFGFFGHFSLMFELSSEGKKNYTSVIYSLSKK